MARSLSETARTDGALLPAESRRLRALIKQSPVNQAAIGIRLGKPDSYVSKLVSGADGASLARWRQVASVIGCSLGDIFQTTEPLPAPPEREFATPADIAREMIRLGRLLQEMEATPPPAAQEAVVADVKTRTRRAIAQADAKRTPRAPEGSAT